MAQESIDKDKGVSGTVKTNLHVVHDEHVGQRIDNYLMRLFRGVPKSRVYRMLRSGEVRVNGGRIDADYRLQSGDGLRLPPIHVPLKEAATGVASAIKVQTLFEDKGLLVINKPAGVAVHGGSGVTHGVIERLRRTRPDIEFLELVHRLDRETSGVLLLAKRRNVLLDLHAQLRDGRTDKRYWALALGGWSQDHRKVDAPLLRQVVGSGERKVSISPDGQASVTDVRVLERFTAVGEAERLGSLSLVECRPRTGRTHQIRVHLQHCGTPILGDDRYGDFEMNRLAVKLGLSRMFLHAASLRFVNPVDGKGLKIDAPLPEILDKFLQRLRKEVKNDGL